MPGSSASATAVENTANEFIRRSVPIRILLTDTDRRPYTARMAMALAAVGCEVSVVATHKNPVQKTKVLQRSFDYSALRPLSSLLHAIATIKPDLIIPCDDRAVKHLHQLHGLPFPAEGVRLRLARLIETSLGAPASFPTLASRHDFLRAATECGIRVPPTRLTNTLDDLRQWRSEQPLPWVLKADGTWGGRGVRLANTFEDAVKYFEELSRPCGLKRAIKRFFINRDSFYLREWWSPRSPTVITQRFIEGRPANCAVFCWEGEVLASIAVEVVSGAGLTRPASVVRMIDGSEMNQAAAAIARRLRISGFFGLDFVLDERASYLLEINPRLTPPCHLSLGDGKDLVGALWTQLSGQRAKARRIQTENQMIAYFPQAWLAKSEFLDSSFHDVPEGEPELERELLQPWPDRTLTLRLFTWLATCIGAASEY